MSIETWKAEFYPAITEEMTPLEAARHSLRKWEGARGENLTKHGLIKEGYLIEDENDDYFVFNTDTCALCCIVDLNCDICPLFKARDSHSCEESRPSEAASPWSIWVIHDTPEPMIRWLKKTVSVLEGASE